MKSKTDGGLGLVNIEAKQDVLKIKNIFNEDPFLISMC